jgi:hypothetical protein
MEKTGIVSVSDANRLFPFSSMNTAMSRDSLALITFVRDVRRKSWLNGYKVSTALIM